MSDMPVRIWTYPIDLKATTPKGYTDRSQCSKEGDTDYYRGDLVRELLTAIEEAKPFAYTETSIPWKNVFHHAAALEETE